ncbi:DUF1489 family protein [Aureimonas fodinaquatilis]|uniref:DUF1489 family protein n=1 Tax=Aureimonas fodinaquatilis TaxID=2565783 RepID=A0A5B0DZ79_9HYPH|nr:DUF1489 family protein [Aureimonas fodinaquatilis]KAA0970509.1 DUF1489 family protein [Aureimonas fodinaquatilis]
MSLHIIKLCVGVETVEDLEAYVAERLELARRSGQAAEQSHVTRMTPRRTAEVLDGGSLYWVIKGQVQLRQPILRLDEFVDAEGIDRCRIVLDPVFIRTRWQPRRPFQGWRYLKPEDAPPDIAAEDDWSTTMPPQLQRELADLGLL